VNHSYGLLCDTCSAQSDYENFAISNTPHILGVITTTVANPNTNQIYVVTMQWEPENGVWYANITDVSLGSQALVNGFIAAEGLFSGPKLIVSAPPNGVESELYGSYLTSGIAAVNTLIQGNSTVFAAVEANVFWAALWNLTSNYPIVVMVFDNGDTAQYQIDHPTEVGLCCSYIPGSAKDNRGKPLDAPATNPGHLKISSGGEPKPGVNNYNYSTPDSYYICSFNIDDDGNVVSFIGCEKIN
jgi:hypothetical protein